MRGVACDVGEMLVLLAAVTAELLDDTIVESMILPKSSSPISSNALSKSKSSSKLIVVSYFIDRVAVLFVRVCVSIRVSPILDSVIGWLPD